VDPDDLGFDDPKLLGDDPALRPFRLYAHTKNMDAMLTYALARRLSDTASTVNGAHPGVIGETGLLDETPGLAEAIHTAYGVEGRTSRARGRGGHTGLVGDRARSCRHHWNVLRRAQGRADRGAHYLRGAC
jgi:NAD(P)-dependent dehydrogenase (short-subunit alcohol dehydrogenase family)